MKNICGRFFFWGGGGGVQIRCIMGNVKVANRLPYPGHTTVFVPRACRFFSAERLWQRCLAGKDVWHRHVQCTCSEERRLKWNCFELESRWQRVGREGAPQWIRFYLFCLFPKLGRFYSKSSSDTQALSSKLYSLKDKFVTILFFSSQLFGRKANLFMVNFQNNYTC